MERLILFDIDGTLTRTQNGYLPFNDAILKTFGFAGDIRSVVPDGNTDPLIVKDIFAKAKCGDRIVEPDQWAQFTSICRRAIVTMWQQARRRSGRCRARIRCCSTSAVAEISLAAW